MKQESAISILLLNSKMAYELKKKKVIALVIYRRFFSVGGFK
jgi:hypothetical protein